MEDLFYNIPTRRRAFRNANDEWYKILDVVSRYAVHCAGVAFSCKKHGDAGTSIAISANASTVERIRQIHGSAVANELIEWEMNDLKWGCKASGWASNANYHVKRTGLLLFINHRSVESSAIKKAIEQLYSVLLPKGGHPWVYLSLEIEPQRVDVNVHPTKREVNFLNEDEIIESVCTAIRGKLAAVDTSRTFMTQTILPGVMIPTLPPQESRDDGNQSAERRSTPKTPASNSKKPYENNLVRTDSKMRKITAMFATGSSPDKGLGVPAGVESMQYESTGQEPVQVRLVSVKSLRAEVRDSMHNALTEVFASHTYVGVVDERRRICAIQSGVKLYLVDYGMIANEYFYQVGLTDFGNFGLIKLDPAPKLLDLLELAAKCEKEDMIAKGQSLGDTNFDEVAPLVAKQLMERRDMLNEYFSLDISDEGVLQSIPLLQKGYVPSIAKLPRFLLRLGPYVDWTDERACFHTFLRELASFYVPEQLPPPRGGRSKEDEMSNNDEDQELDKRRTQMTWALEHVLFPAFKGRLLATKGLLKGVIEVASLRGLYKVFERC